LCTFINSHSIVFIGFFFFQAEDGIRDRNVTGVQTCALPISETSAMGYGFSAAAVVESPESACGVSLPEQAVKASPPANRVANAAVVCREPGAAIKDLFFSIVEAAFH